VWLNILFNNDIRVTCRDWFQLSLKEGLTVFRDQVLSPDLSCYVSTGTLNYFSFIKYFNIITSCIIDRNSHLTWEAVL
jgi:aminopeptidase N